MKRPTPVKRWMAFDRLMAVSLLAIAPLAAAACSDESGPGSVQVELSASVPLAAASVELVGSGIQGVEAAPGLWIAGEPLEVPDGTPGYRAVVVTETPGALVLSVNVAELDGRLPQVQVLEAIGPDNRPIADLSSVTARVRR